MQCVIYRITEIGDFIVYQRGAWHRRERLPGFTVDRASNGRSLREFRRKKHAISYARAMAQAEIANGGIKVIGI